jgi:hypothetical protein
MGLTNYNNFSSMDWRSSDFGESVGDYISMVENHAEPVGLP